jgi:hypothetical protein
MRWMVVAALFLAPMAAEAVNKCEIDGRTIYQNAPCPEGAVVEQMRPPGAREPAQAADGRIRGATEQEQAALDRMAERNREARSARERRQQVPKLDVATSCKRVASAGSGYSATIYNRCIEMQQSAYDDLQDFYASVPEPLRQRCMRIATAGGGGSYSALKRCIEMQMDASRSTPEFRY